MKVLNNNRKINVRVGDVIKYWNDIDMYPRYAMIIGSYKLGYSAAVLSDKIHPDNVGQDLPDGVTCQFFTVNSPTTVYQIFCQKWGHVEKVPFFGIEGHPEDYEAVDELSKSKEQQNEMENNQRLS